MDYEIPYGGFSRISIPGKDHFSMSTSCALDLCILSPYGDTGLLYLIWFYKNFKRNFYNHGGIAQIIFSWKMIQSISSLVMLVPFPESVFLPQGWLVQKGGGGWAEWMLKLVSPPQWSRDCVPTVQGWTFSSCETYMISYISQATKSQIQCSTTWFKVLGAFHCPPSLSFKLIFKNFKSPLLVSTICNITNISTFFLRIKSIFQK